MSRIPKRTALGMVIPPLAWLGMFLLVPLVLITAFSFATRGPYGGVSWHLSVENYLRVTDWIYLKIFLNSLRLAVLTTLLCLLIGYPMAYLIATSRPPLSRILKVLVVIPFWTNFVVRAYASKVWMGQLSSGEAPSVYLFSQMNVLVGMVTNYLPFMVLPLYVALEKFDLSYLEASRDLGASAFRSWISILLPLTRRGMVTGIVLVFTPALGEFVIPDFLGGARTLLVGSLISDQFLKTRDWPFGSALSVVLMGGVMLSFFILERFREEAPEECSSHEG